jgi:hypothetical protein
VLPKDIHQFWWFSRAKASTTLENQALRDVILDPVVVKGKGRPKGKGKKGSVAHGMIHSFKTACITVLILHFLNDLGTRQEPSQFEFASTAPANRYNCPV